MAMFFAVEEEDMAGEGGDEPGGKGGKGAKRPANGSEVSGERRPGGVGGDGESVNGVWAAR